MFKGLPDLCYHTVEETGETIILKKGNSRFYSFGYQMDARKLNEEIGVTKSQEQAMLIGSMFGWDAPGANPNIYDKEGILIKEQLE